MKEKTTFSISGKEVVCSGKRYVLGQLFIDFLKLDLTAYETERLKIKDVLENNDIDVMKDFTKDLKPPKKMQRGFGGLDYILLGITDDMSLKDKYAVYALYKATFLIEHLYFNIVDYSKMREINSNQLLIDFDLLSLQKEYNEAMLKCLFEYTPNKTTVERYKDCKIEVSGKAELVFEIADTISENNVKEVALYETFFASKMSSLLYTEFMKMVQNNVWVAKCENCGNIFVPETKGNYNVKYCNNKECRKLGATNSFKMKIKTDPIYRKYEKAYKRYYAQKRKGVITQEQFDNWVKIASKLKKDAIKSNLSEDEFELPKI